MGKTEEALRAEVPGVCRIYYDQVWDEALNQVGVEAFSVLRKAKNVYNPPQPSVLPLRATLRQTPLPKWQILKKAAPARSHPLLAILQKWPSSLGQTKKELR